MSTISKKICLIGDFSVGKTSLIRRFVDRQFSDQYLSTVGVKISRKPLELDLPNEQKSQSVQLLIWDIEGSTKFKAIAPTYLQGASGAIIVADVTRQDTIANLNDHIGLFLSVNPKGLFILALNKSDLIDEEKLDKLTKSINCPNLDNLVQTYQTSAKTGKDVDEMFSQLAWKIIFST